MSDTHAPNDLIDLSTAAKMVDRSKSTIRNWLRDGKLTKYRAQPGNERSKSLVSKASLLQLAGLSLSIDPPRPGSASAAGVATSAEVVKLQAELAAARAETKGARVEAATLREALVAIQKTTEILRDTGQEALEQGRNRAADLLFALKSERESLEHSRADVLRLQAENDSLRATQSVSWFRRLLTG